MTEPVDPGAGRHETPLERADRNLAELLNELRVALPGVQVLFAFLLIVPFSQRYAYMTDFERKLYFGVLLCTGLAAILLIAPSMHHRIEFRHRDKEYLVVTANRLTIAGVERARRRDDRRDPPRYPRPVRDDGHGDHDERLRLGFRGCLVRDPAAPARDGAAGPSVSGLTAPQRPSVRVNSTTCWNVGRFWNANGGIEIALATVQRFLSKQLACASDLQSPDCPYRSAWLTPSASASDANSAARQAGSDPLPQYTRE